MKGTPERGTLTFHVGDATKPAVPGPKIIAHGCNTVGAWGAGFVMAVSARWPQPREEYLRNQEAGKNRLGFVQVVPVEDEIWVANMITQSGIRSSANPRPLNYDAVEECLEYLALYASNVDATIHMPRIGAGLAGGLWPEIEHRIRMKLCREGLDVYVYDLAPVEEPEKAPTRRKSKVS